MVDNMSRHQSCLSLRMKTCISDINIHDKFVSNDFSTKLT